MLKLTDLSLRRGGKLLFEGANMSLYAGQKVGLVGANGSGKSSLFALIRGELQPDRGDFSLPARLAIAHVAQETPSGERSAQALVMAGDPELAELEGALRSAEAAGEGPRLADLHARFEAIGGYSAPSRAARLLHGLGFPPGEESLPVNRFSGGWRMRLNLAQALMCRSDLLLLDEPTNHLDLDAVIWLEGWLRDYPGTLILISHDRDFLDAVTGGTLHIAQGQLRLYAGNYSAFERQRAEQLAQQQAAYSRQQQEVAQIRRFVERFRAKATKARQAQSRLKALERMELIAPAHVDSPFHFAFRPPERLLHPLIRLEGVSLGYGETPVLTGVDLALAPGDRIGLLGPNRAGKSSLIKLLAGALAPLAGERELAQDLRIGYFAQHQVEQLRPEDSPLQHLRRLDPLASEQALRDFLGSLGFPGDSALAPVGPFSGGEKARVTLALLIWQRPKLLLLDEPTNHLDLEMRLALSEALQSFEGGLVVVSHDRHLLRLTSDQLWLVHAGRVQPFDGDLDDYAAWLGRREPPAGEGPREAGGAHRADERRDRRRREADERRRLAPLREALRRVEERLAALASEQQAIGLALARPELYEEGNKAELLGLLETQRSLGQSAEAVEAAWLRACEELEALSAQLA